MKSNHKNTDQKEQVKKREVLLPKLRKKASQTQRNLKKSRQNSI